MMDIVPDLKRVSYVMFIDGYHSSDLAGRAVHEILALRARAEKAEAENELLRSELKNSSKTHTEKCVMCGRPL